MEMVKGKNSTSRLNYEKLTYFRWKALIRSKEYKEFYKEVKSSLKIEYDLDSIEDELYSIELKYVNEDGDLCFKPLLEGREQKGYSGLSAEVIDDIEEYKELLSEKENLENQEVDILSEAENRFGLFGMVDKEDLKPIDYPLGRLPITFKDYLPAMPDDDGTRSFYEKCAVREVKYKNDKMFNADTGHEILPGLNLKFFCINEDMPPGLILESLRKKLMAGTEMSRADRKEFRSWEEAFKVWDIEQQERNHLKTAKRMGWKLNRKGIEYTDEDLRSRVNKKLKVANELITLAGQGKFKTL
jgi:hypothetical protein